MFIAPVPKKDSPPRPVPPPPHLQQQLSAEEALEQRLSPVLVNFAVSKFEDYNVFEGFEMCPAQVDTLRLALDKKVVVGHDYKMGLDKG